MQPVPIGHADDRTDVVWRPVGPSLLVTGGSGSGKSTLVSALIERLTTAGYQLVVVDPEGDFEDLPGAVSVGTPQAPPSVQQVTDLVDAGTGTTVASLAVAMGARPGVCRELLGRLAEMVARMGRPHAVVVDEAHHAFPLDAPVDTGTLPSGLVLVSNAPEDLQHEVLTGVDTVVAIGDGAESRIDAAAEAIGTEPPPAPAADGRAAVAWWVAGGQLTWFDPLPARHRRRRHASKMVAGDVGQDQRLVITGPEGALSLEVGNLSEMLRIAEGVDDATWSYHRERHDWSRWVRDVLGDDELADAIETGESKDLDADASRRAAARGGRRSLLRSRRSRVRVGIAPLLRRTCHERSVRRRPTGNANQHSTNITPVTTAVSTAQTVS